MFSDKTPEHIVNPFPLPQELLLATMSPHMPGETVPFSIKTNAFARDFARAQQ